MKRRSALQVFVVLLALVLTSMAGWAATVSTRATRAKRPVSETPTAKRNLARVRHRRTTATASTRKASTRGKKVRLGRRGHYYYERFTASPFDSDPGAGDVTAGEDPVVRQAAIDALGNMNGTVVAIDPSSGRILAMVNQKVALSAGAIPCSTIKVPVALAALSEGLITKDTKVALGKSWRMDLTDALAHSNNAYFETVGRKLGFDRYSYYAHQFGLGELAGWNIPEEHLGTFPSEPLQAKLGGVGKMCSFGESISMTPLQLGAIVAAIANGGTLYYLQHPTAPDDVANFQPKVKRYLNIKSVLPQIEEGMAGAVRYGTARSLRVNFSEEQVLGKTGTCSNNSGTRYGWFASFANTDYGRIVTVIFLRGNRSVFGPKAAELSGRFYRNLYDHSFFANKNVMPTNTAGAKSVIGATN